jgi:hypothetical protein
MKKRQVVLACVVSALVGGLAWVVLLLWPSSRIVAQWTQPGSIHYGNYDPYALSVIDRGTDYSQLPWGRHHELFIGHGTDAPAYGHFVRFSFHPASGNLDAYIRQSTVDWTETGVTFTAPSGHRVFIPKAVVIGGR